MPSRDQGLRVSGFGEAMGLGAFQHAIPYLWRCKDVDRSKWERVDQFEWEVQLRNLRNGFSAYSKYLDGPWLAFVRQLVQQVAPDMLESVDKEIARRIQDRKGNAM